MDGIVCKVAEAIGVELECDDIEIAHRFNIKKGTKTIVVKFVSHIQQFHLCSLITQVLLQPILRCVYLSTRT